MGGVAGLLAELREPRLRLGSKFGSRSEHRSLGAPVNGTFVLPTQTDPRSTSSHVPLAPAGAQTPGQTLPPQAHGHPRGLPPPPVLHSQAVPVGTAWEDFSQICYKNLIFVVARQGEFFSFRVGSREERRLPHSQLLSEGQRDTFPSLLSVFSHPG